ncbi:unnamed protein product [Prorocentrum cordatum]|uniref:Uncharacterized protein n=1 Tax=Prorocentrum cordatum TaxID=2364126 RepID=A0ABN9QWA2_9DINO|nr:unnamed protein product [Polarella glacialis]
MAAKVPSRAPCLASETCTYLAPTSAAIAMLFIVARPNAVVASLSMLTASRAWQPVAPELLACSGAAGQREDDPRPGRRARGAQHGDPEMGTERMETTTNSMARHG